MKSIAGAFACVDGLPQPVSAETVVAPDAYCLPDDAGGWHGVGTGLAAADALLQTRLRGQLARVDAAALPHAADLARLAAVAYARGEAIAPERVEPAYLRDNVALTLEQQAAQRAAR